MAELSAAHGYGEVSVAAVVDRAGVSRATFYELFRDKEKCFVATMEEGLRRLMASVLPAVYRGAELEWPERVKAVIEALLNYLAADPDYSQTAMVEAFAGGEEAFERYSVGTQMLVALLDEGRGLVDDDLKLPATTARAVLGAGESLVAGEMAAGRVDRVPELLPDFLYMALLPYLGQDQALRHAGLSRSR
jgi:AcrR family transcriptional regulator